MPDGAGEPGARIVGREPELAVMREFLGTSGTLGALVLSGGPGIGKTTLWEAGVEAARVQGLRVLSARPSDAEAQLAFAALTDLLDGVDTKTLAGLPVPQRRALEVALLRVEPEGSRPEQRAIALGFTNALRSLAAREPLLVAIDDVHWLDPPSADALVFAARRLKGDAVGFLLTKRTGVPSTVEQAIEARGLERVEVSPMSLGAMRRLLSERLGLSMPRQLLRRVFESSQGNPLLALELGRTLAERGPPEIGEEIPVSDAVEDLLGTRVEQLPGAVRSLLLAVSLSADLQVSQLAEIADQAALECAIDSGVLLVEKGRVRPSHPLLAAAARRHSSPHERRELHLELAKTVADDALRARHLALAAEGPNAGLAATVAAAAAGASARGAAEEAVELAEHALRLTPPDSAARSDRLLALTDYLVVTGDEQRVTDLLLPEVASLPGGAVCCRAHLLLADGGAIANADDLREHLEQAFIESDGDAALRAEVLASKSWYTAIVWVERISDAEAWALEALPAARHAGPEAERRVLTGLAWARILRGRPIDALSERFETVSDAVFTIGDSLDRAAGLRLAFRGDVNGARAAFTQLLTLADERGEAWSYFMLRLQLCELELRAGEWGAASRLLDEWDQSDGAALVGTRPTYNRCSALLAAGRGLPEDAKRWTAETVTGAEATGVRWDMLEAVRAGGIAALLAHEPERAAESLRTVWEHTQREGVDDPGAFPVAPDLVEALVELGELDEALSVIDRLQELSEEQAHPWGLATVKRCNALVRLASPDYDEDSAAALGQAAVAYGELGLRFDRARSLLSVGRAQRRHRKWAAARGSLEHAAGAFDELGSPGWAEEAHSELSRVGARRPRPAGELTTAELRAAELAAQGLSNKEIARTLFVTVHTVEVHLSHAYAKLGIRSRTQLASRLEE